MGCLHNCMMSFMAIFCCGKKANDGKEVIPNEGDIDESGKEKWEKDSRKKQKQFERKKNRRSAEKSEVEEMNNTNEQVEFSDERKEKIDASTNHTKTNITAEKEETEIKKLEETTYLELYSLPEFQSNPVVTDTTFSSEQPNHRKFQMTRSDVNLTKKAKHKLKNCSQIRPDVTILVKDREFRLHKKVLCEESTYFSKMIDRNSSRQYTLKLDDKLNISPDIFHYIMTFLYCGKMKQKLLPLETIYNASRILGIQRAVQNSLKEILHYHLIQKHKILNAVSESRCFRCAGQTNGFTKSQFLSNLTCQILISPDELASKPETSKSQEFRNESESYWNAILFTSIRRHYGQQIAMPFFPNHLKALPENIRKKPTYEYLEYSNSWTYGLDLLFNDAN